MSAESMQLPFGGRGEYNQTPLERLEECEVITDAIDSIFHASPVSSGSRETAAESDRTSTYIKRSFEYLERDSSSGWAWPLNGKRFDITYIRSTLPGTHTHEAYVVTIGTFIHQQGIHNVGMQNTYTIEYYGAERSSATSVIEQPNFIERKEPNMVTRDTTPYDQEQLFNEIAELQNALDAGEREYLVVTTLDGTL